MVGFDRHNVSENKDNTDVTHHAMVRPGKDGGFAGHRQQRPSVHHSRRWPKLDLNRVGASYFQVAVSRRHLSESVIGQRLPSTLLFVFAAQMRSFATGINVC